MISSSPRPPRSRATAEPAKLNDLEAGDRVKINAQAKGTSLGASDIEARSAE